MGNESSLPLELGATFDADEIKRLGKREGSISVELDSQHWLRLLVYLCNVYTVTKSDQVVLSASCSSFFISNC